MKSLNISILSQAANEARGLAMDAVAACKSGHLGLPLGCADIGAVLFGHVLSVNPQDPDWLNRDRFILSAGHGSMFLYSWLHLAGFEVSIEDLAAFRQFHSKTPGHPEVHHTSGVECTTGPLGQGIASGVGMAMAAKMMAGHFNTSKHFLFDHKVVVLFGDGCMQEGISSEASSFAAHHHLDNLIMIYDSNDVTLDAMASKTQSEDVAARYLAYGFDVETVNGHDMQAFLDAYITAKKTLNNKPKLIIIKTKIGKGISQVEGTSKAHGEGGVQFVADAKVNLGLPEQSFYVSERTRTYFYHHKKDLIEAYQVWQAQFKIWQQDHPDLNELLESSKLHLSAEQLFAQVPEFTAQEPLATRLAGERVLQALASTVPNFISGSADLHGSTKNYIQHGGDFSPTEPKGRNIYFGIREHAMGGILNGFACNGIFRPSGATFLTFSDYMRPAVRLAALSNLPVIYIWTHDSVGVGEDGPTHQPVETISSLRLIPNLDVIRPADIEETVGAYVAALERTDGPTALILTRQNVPYLKQIPVEDRRKGVLRGGYIALKESAALKLIILSTGSELQHALQAAQQLGTFVRVVSMPCTDRFDRQSVEYKESVLPKYCALRISIEAGVTCLWYKYVGCAGATIGIDRFGMSAPGDAVLNAFGMNAQKIIDTAQKLLEASAV